MKKLFFLLSLLLLVGVSTQANVSQYRVDDTQIETLFAQAEQVDLSQAVDYQGMAMPVSAPAMLKKSDKNPAVAFILAFFVGGFGIHRAYLGTETMTWVGYILTCGGIFGIVPFVDWIVLLIGLVEDDISQYVDNPKFFMW
ncbi:MAG: TM2 domain-containing protein [Bacteroidales bacterium]